MVEPGQRAQPRGPRLGRVVEARVLQRDARLRREALQQAEVLGQRTARRLVRLMAMTACTRPAMTTGWAIAWRTPAATNVGPREAASADSR